MMQTCSVPLVLDENPNGGFDYLATPSCKPFRPFFSPENEVIMHMQVSLLSFCLQKPHLTHAVCCTQTSTACLILGVYLFRMHMFLKTL